MGGKLLTDKLVFRWLEVLGVWSLDSATPFPSAYPVHASGSPQMARARMDNHKIRRRDDYRYGEHFAGW